MRHPVIKMFSIYVNLVFWLVDWRVLGTGWWMMDDEWWVMSTQRTFRSAPTSLAARSLKLTTAATMVLREGFGVFVKTKNYWETYKTPKEKRWLLFWFKTGFHWLAVGRPKTILRTGTGSHYLFHLPMLASLALADSSTAAWSCRTFHPKSKTFLQYQFPIYKTKIVFWIYEIKGGSGSGSSWSHLSENMPSVSGHLASKQIQIPWLQFPGGPYPGEEWGRPPSRFPSPPLATLFSPGREQSISTRFSSHQKLPPTKNYVPPTFQFL